MLLKGAVMIDIGTGGVAVWRCCDRCILGDRPRYTAISINVVEKSTR